MEPGEWSSRSLDELIAQVDHATAATTPAATAISALAARLAMELAGGLKELSGNLFIAKKQLVERMDTLTSEISKASDESSKHTRSLVAWTKVLVFASIAYTLITGGLLVVAILRR